jgi:pyridoxal phosphate enzyme (YggS family)
MTFAAAAGIADRLSEIRARIAAVSGGRSVEIVAVTKGFGPEAVEAALGAGLTAVGENYAQELLAKADALSGAQCHFIGAVQRNKVRVISGLVACWQTVDRLPVAAAISRHAPGAAVLVQVNLSDDPARAGCAWDETAGLVTSARDLGLDVRGLMGVGPAGGPEAARPGFAALAAKSRELGLAEVSMGMSDDLEVAVAEGSTMVRLGTALFGPRPDRRDLRR